MMGSNESAVARVVTERIDCEEHNRLLDEFGAAVHELLKLHEDQFRAIVQSDGDSSRFDILIHMASEKKQLAKYAQPTAEHAPSRRMSERMERAT